MSYREKSIWATVVLNAYIVYYYLSQLYSAQSAGVLDESYAVGLFIKIIFMSIIIEIISQTIIAIVDHKEADKKADEREQKFSLIGYRNAYYVLTAGVFTALFLLWQVDFGITQFGFMQLSAAHNILSLLVVCFLIAEIVQGISQLFFYRRGY